MTNESRIEEIKTRTDDGWCYFCSKTTDFLAVFGFCKCRFFQYKTNWNAEINGVFDMVDNRLCQRYCRQSYNGSLKYLYTYLQHSGAADYLDEIKRFKDDKKRFEQIKKMVKRNDYFKSKEWIKIRYDFLSSIEKVCLCCGKRSPEKELSVAHIKPIDRFPELKGRPENLHILCKECRFGQNINNYTLHNHP